ncbi:MAG: orotidine-5'-phosphate decarboxylase [Nitrosomonas sp.]|nr:MAG: orotidine-5'-phosphate decarboxylase [Nitrosomonas sp.]
MTQSFSYLSKKHIPARERLIFALDVPTAQEAKALVEMLGDSVNFYKLGLELFMDGNYFELVDWLISRNKKVFVDLKFFDVAETVRRAVGRLKTIGASFATVHPVNDDMLRAVAEEKGALRILVVTVLTSLSQDDARDLGFACNVEDLVLSRARRAIELGCDGVISSGLEVPRLREQLGGQFLVVSPGIRPVDNRLSDDQKRVVDVNQAFLNGADYIVVGRPIRNAPDPRTAAEAIQQTIAGIFSAPG